MSDEEKLKSAKDRYLMAMHAVQTGVSYLMHKDPNETDPKHLRVGVNSALVSNGALVELLIKKGVFTELEFTEALADKTEAEARSYETRLSKEFNMDVNLL